MCALFYILPRALDALPLKVQVDGTNDSTEVEQSKTAGNAIGGNQTTDNSTKTEHNGDIVYGDKVQGNKTVNNFGPLPYTPIDLNVRKAVIENLRSAYSSYAPEGTSVIVHVEVGDQRDLMGNELLALLQAAGITSRRTSSQTFTVSGQTIAPFVYSYYPSRQVFAEKILEALEPRFDLKNAVPSPPFQNPILLLENTRSD